jgi:hypothetical protein
VPEVSVKYLQRKYPHKINSHIHFKGNLICFFSAQRTKSVASVRRALRSMWHYTEIYMWNLPLLWRMHLRHLNCGFTKLRYHVICLYVNQVYVRGKRIWFEAVDTTVSSENKQDRHYHVNICFILLLMTLLYVSTLTLVILRSTRILGVSFWVASFTKYEFILCLYCYYPMNTRPRKPQKYLNLQFPTLQY